MDKAIARSGQLIDRGALAYASHFSVEELNAGTEFYRSPLGHKLLSSTVTLADILDGADLAPEPERMQTARALVKILKQTDPFIAALGNTPQTFCRMRRAVPTIQRGERIRRPKMRRQRGLKRWPHSTPESSQWMS